MYDDPKTVAPYNEVGLQQVPLLERLKRQLADAQQGVAELKEAIEILQRQPELERLLTLIRRF